MQWGDVRRKSQAGSPVRRPVTPKSSFPQPLPGHPSGRQIYFLIFLSFIALISVTWVSEYFDPINVVLSGHQSEPNIAEAWSETFWTLLVMLMLLVATRVVVARLRYLEGLLHMCSFCKSISIDGQWLPFEQYLQQNSKLRLSHSLCPDCACEHYGYSETHRLEDEAAELSRREAKLAADALRKP